MPICTLIFCAVRHVINPCVCAWFFMPINENEFTVAVVLLFEFAWKRSHCFSLITPDFHFHEIMSPDSVQPYNSFGLFGSHCVAMIFLPGTPSKSRTYSPVCVLYTKIWSSAMTNNELEMKTNWALKLGLLVSSCARYSNIFQRNTYSPHGEYVGGYSITLPPATRCNFKCKNAFSSIVKSSMDISLARVAVAVPLIVVILTSVSSSLLPFGKLSLT